MTAYDQAIRAVSAIAGNKELSDAEVLEALENVRDKAEEWIDAVRDDMRPD